MLRNEYNPNLVEDLCRTAEILRDEETWLAELAAEHFHPIPLQGGIALLCDPLMRLPKALLRRVIRQALCTLDDSLQGGNFEQVESIMGLMKAPGSSARINLPMGVQACKVYDRLEFIRVVHEAVPPGVYEIPVPGSERIPAFGIEVTSEILAPTKQGSGSASGIACFDFDKCTLPLRVRTRQPGDRFHPSGFGRTKKVKCFLIDEKIPLSRRDRIPLFVNGRDEILWIGGMRTDARFAVGTETTRVLRMTMKAFTGGDHVDPR